MAERGGLWGRRVAAVGLLAGATVAQAAIYSCTDANGKRLTSDRPIPECINREQRVLNPSGSVMRVLPPTPTPDERQEQEAHARKVEAERAAFQDAMRRDRNLMVRFPNEETHNRSRDAALDDARSAVQRSERRLAELAAERKPLVEEAEFYHGHPLPPKLRQQLESNETATEAARVLVHNQQAEVVRVNALYDVELERLRKLWGGAAPGTMGALTPGLPASGVKNAASD